MSILSSAEELYTLTALLLAALLAAIFCLIKDRGKLDAERRKFTTLERDHSILLERLQAMEDRIDRERKDFEGQKAEIKRAGELLLEEKEKRIQELLKELRDTRHGLNAALEQKQLTESELASLKAEGREKLQAAEEKITLLEEAEKRLTNQFENLANRIFEEKQQKFSRLSRDGIEALLDPMNRQLKDFRNRVENIYDSENRQRASLITEIKSLKDLNERIGKDAINLTMALKGSSKVRGNWGEVQLERILEGSGLKKGLEYETQPSLQDKNGRRFQPDVIIHLPENRDVVIDSKVSLVDYERFHAAEEEKERMKFAKAHIASLRSHIKGLSAKKYDELTGITSLDMVVMFVPLEPALHLGLEYEPGLFNEAFNSRILLAGPSTLMATLHTINNIWRHEYQNRNAVKIATEAGRLHDQFVLFVESLEDIGVQLERAQKSYITAHKRLGSGRGNLIRRVNNLKELGAKTRKELSEELADSGDENV